MMAGIKKIWKYRKGKWAIVILLFFLLIAIFADFIANEKPIYCKYDGESYFPVLHEYGERLGISDRYDFLKNGVWNDLDLENAVYPIIKFSSSSIDQNSTSFSSPGTSITSGQLIKKHWLGSDPIGRDVAAGIVQGSRKTILIAFFAMLIACVIGFVFGILSGYYGDYNVKLSLWGFLVAGFLVSISWFQWVYGHWTFGASFFISIILIWLTIVVSKRVGGKQFYLPLDLMVMRLIEVFKSVPALFILLAFLAIIAKPSFVSLILIIGLLRWSTIARVLRGELLNLNEKKYVQSARVLGATDFKILVKHLLPNAISPILTIIAFGFAGTILLEATISFLGIGLSAEEVTWGSILSEARNNFSAWWLAVFPGSAIFLLVIAFNYLGDTLNEMSLSSD